MLEYGRIGYLLINVRQGILVGPKEIVILRRLFHGHSLLEREKVV